MVERAVRRGHVSSLEARPESVRTVVVVDDHRTFADLLTFSLDAATDLECVGVAYDIATGLSLVASNQPDLVVMDYEFAGELRDGVMATAAITSRFPTCCVVLLTGHADAVLLRRAAEAGASSLMPKDGSLPDLLATLRTAGGDGLQVHPPLLSSLVTAEDGRVQQDSPLSKREQEVLGLLMLGLGAQEAADQLGISKNTCRGYIKSLLWKLDAHTQLEAVAIARRQGLVLVSDAR